MTDNKEIEEKKLAAKKAFEETNKKIQEQIEKAQAEGKQVPESVWAEGIPDTIDENDKIKSPELMSMAVDYIMKNVIIKKGFKIQPGFPRAEFPNIVCKRNGIAYSVIVAPSVYPAYVTIDDKSRLSVVELSKKAGIIPLFAPIGYRSVDPERAQAGLLLRGDMYVTTFPGFIELNDSPKQSLMIKDSELFKPEAD